MSQKLSNMLWLRDTLEHLTACQQQLEWTEDESSTALLTEAMLRDLESCRKLCEALHRRSRLCQPV